MVNFGVEDGTKTHRLYDPQHEKIRVSRDLVFEEEKKWNWCSVVDNKHFVTKFTTVKLEGDPIDLESAPTTTPTSSHISSPVYQKARWTL